MSEVHHPLPASLTRLLTGRRTSIWTMLLRLFARASRPQDLPRGLQSDVGISLPPPEHKAGHRWY